MAIKRSQNWLDQSRVDVPHVRSIESGIRADFDDLLNGFVTGIDNSYIVNGFEVNMTGAVGSSSSALQVIVAEGSIFHGNSTAAGTFLTVPKLTTNETLSSTTNTKVTGSFTPSAQNYIGLELTRAIDNSTTSQVYFFNPSSKTEFTKTVPLAETFNYQFVITSSSYAANVLPLCVVETDASNNVLRVEDRRPMLFRLGSSGSATPNPSYTYPWTNHTEGRVENPNSSSSSSTSPFKGGDKQIKNLKEWMNSIMSAVQEVKGTPYWYSYNAGGSILKLRGDLANLMMTGKGDISHSVSVSGRMNWSDDIFFNLIGSRVSYKINSNIATSHITLSDDQVAYINFVRDVPVIPNLIFTNGVAVVTSVGAVSWTSGLLAEDYIKDATQMDTKYYKILSVDSATQVTLTSNFAEASELSGIPARYAWGSYLTAASPSTDRHIKIANRKDVPFTEDTYWLFLREDNAGSLARVYVRGGGFGELEQGETRQISDNTSQQVLDYVGSPSETQDKPDYTNAVVTAVSEQFTITLPAASSITTGQYFTAFSAKDFTKHYFWFNKDGGLGDPLVVDSFGHAIVISTGNANTVVASATQVVVDALGDFNAILSTNTVVVTLSSAGTSTDAANVDVSGLSIAINTQGVGSANHYILDEDNLTKSIKKLDEQLADFVNSITTEGFEEPKSVISGSPSNTNEITGPVVTSTTINIPLNSRNSYVQQSYVVGSGTLAVYLNGVRLLVNSDYTEDGISGADSISITNLIQLELLDVLLFKLEGQGAGGGGGSVYTGTNLGAISDANVFKQISSSAFQFRRLTAGANTTITEGTNDIVISSSAGVSAASAAIYSVNNTFLSTDDVGLADTSSSNILFTLPDASTVPGHIYYFKKIHTNNVLSIKSVSAQTLDGTDIDASPYTISIQYESVTIVSVSGNWYIL
jgi:hypothetical protein